ncbi:MAG: TIGR02221 family CRISPR-associated protein [Thermoanaerobacteraceae bacterium]|nr:TIGR02221 family CRISPR-associated protein [Thermoanaerobacteraceae bacterium]
MLVALSTIGPTEYKEIEYSWAPPGQEPRTYRTALFPLAVDTFFRPEKLLLMVTSEARTHENRCYIERVLGQRFQLVPIPSGRTEEELWQIFDIVSDAVPEGAEVILDVTHAFRSLPFVIFGVINYLRRTKGIRLERIVYGAYDAKETGPDGVQRAPVFDLTMLVDLHEWLQAVEAFTLRSEGQKLADLLDEAHRRPWLSGERGEGELPRQLQRMAGCIKEFSQSVRLLRPLEALEAAARAQTLARQVEQEAARWAKPFRHILLRLTEELSPLATGDARALDEEGLRRQLSLIKHYVEKDLIVQAVLLGREWLVNWLAWRAGNKPWLNRDTRQELERVLGLAARRLQEGDTEAVPSWYDALPEAGAVADLWRWLTNLRNDVAHCAMNDHPAPSSSIRERAEELVQRLIKLL